jgi:AraC-like DNA-binding protein
VWEPTAFLADPIGACIHAGTSLVWAADASLGGAVCWGRPTADDARAVMPMLEVYAHPATRPPVDVILDARQVEAVDPEPLLVLFDWAGRQLDRLRAHVRLLIGVVPDGVHGITLAGTLPALGGGVPIRICREPLEAYRLARPETGAQIYETLSREVAALRNVPLLASTLRDLLRAARGNLSLADAAARLGRSPRSLQRELVQLGISYRDEQVAARFRAVTELLGQTDTKLAVIAAEVGLSEAGLALLVRRATGLGPLAYRARLRNEPA